MDANHVSLTQKTDCNSTTSPAPKQAARETDEQKQTPIAAGT